MPEKEERTITRRGLLALGAAAVPTIALAAGVPRGLPRASASESPAPAAAPVYYFC